MSHIKYSKPIDMRKFNRDTSWRIDIASKQSARVPCHPLSHMRVGSQQSLCDDLQLSIPRMLQLRASILEDSSPGRIAGLVIHGG